MLGLLHNRALVPILGIVLAGNLNRLQSQQPLLSITSPTDGTVITIPVSTGKITVPIAVSADPSVQNISISTEISLPEAQPASGTNQFSLTIPNTITLGTYHLTAVGETAAGVVFSVPVAIDVERQDTPTDVTAGPESLHFQNIGETTSIIVSATFSDGTVLDVTKSSLTSYRSSNTNVAKVDSSGRVTSVGPGTADIIVRAGLATYPPMSVVDVEVRNGDLTPQVLLKKPVPPVYPGIAIIAQIAGDVRLKVSVRPDGSIESVAALSGHPILAQAAVESAKHSQFQCRNCNGPTEKFLIYTFQLPAVRIDADPCCCSSGHESSIATTPQVTESEGRVTITAPPLCVCPDACTFAWAQAHSKFRSSRCLYLWKCGTRHIGIL